MCDVSYEVQTLFYSPNHHPGEPFTLYFEAEADAYEFIDAVSKLPHSATILLKIPRPRPPFLKHSQVVLKDYPNA